MKKIANEKSKVYKVVNNVDAYIYIGSTNQKLLSKRMGNHRARSRNPARTSKFYEHMRTIGSRHFKIVLVNEFDNLSNEQLEREEFLEMQKYPKDILLNTNTEFGRRAPEHVNKLRKLGVESPVFKRGSIMKIAKPGKWPIDNIQFRWHENGRQKSKSWSIKKHGDAEARRLAEEFRNTIYPINE